MSRKRSLKKREDYRGGGYVARKRVQSGGGYHMITGAGTMGRDFPSPAGADTPRALQAVNIPYTGADPNITSVGEDIKSIKEYQDIIPPTGAVTGELDAQTGTVDKATRTAEFTTAKDAAEYEAAKASGIPEGYSVTPPEGVAFLPEDQPSGGMRFVWNSETGDRIEVPAMGPTGFATKQVTKEAEAAGPAFTEEMEVTTAERIAEDEEEAKAPKVDFDEDLRSQINPQTGVKEQVATTPDAERRFRDLITGEPAPDGTEAVIANAAGYEAALRREVKGEAATRAAGDMLAEIGDLPPDITAAVVEDPASVTAQIDNEPVEVQAAVAALPTEALMSVQIEGLLAGMDEGKTPAWAKPAVAQVQQMMAQRGLSVSSVARDSLFNAIIQSAMPIAQNNAQALQQRAAQNLSNEQQANLAQASQDMQRRMANLANRQTSASQSAQMSQQMKVMQSQFRQDTTMLTAQQQQQTRTQNLQNRQQAAVLEYQTKEALNAQNLGNEQQMEMANLQIEAERAGADQAAVNQERLAEFQVAADFMAKNSGFKQQMELANLTNDQQMRLANLSALNQAASEQLTADQQTELSNLNKTLETNKLQSQIASQMNLAQLNVDQERAVKNAATVANIDLTKFNAAQQTELANSKFMQSMTMTDFNARQQSAMQNATAMVTMDMAAADQRTKLAITNAQNFLQMDMANLNNEQQSLVLDQQLLQQRMLSDQSAKNASLQFNATSENQTNQFMANLGQQIEQFNSTQANAMTQFNKTEENRLAAIDEQNKLDASKFNADLGGRIKMFDQDLEFRTDQWNAQNAQAIEQSNIAWRRKANTIGTAAQNAANQQASQYAFNMSQAEQNFYWQSMRDASAFAQQDTTSEKERAMQILSGVMSNEQLMVSEKRRDEAARVGRALAAIIWPDEADPFTALLR